MKDIENLKELAKDLPKEVKDKALALVELMGTVVEGIGDTPIEWRPDFLKILQGTSDRSKYGKTTPIGAMIVGEEVLPASVDVYPIMMWKGRQYWSPDQTEAKILCSSPNAEMGYLGYKCSECPHSKWEDGKSDCATVWHVAVITADLSKLFIINFSKTAYVTGTTWKGYMTKAMKPPYMRVYALTTETHKQYKNVEALVVTPYNPSDKKTPDNIAPFLEALYKRFDADRKEHVAAFMELAASRGARVAAQLADKSEDTQLLAATVEVQPAEVSTGQKDLASKYTM